MTKGAGFRLPIYGGHGFTCSRFDTAQAGKRRARAKAGGNGHGVFATCGSSSVFLAWFFRDGFLVGVRGLFMNGLRIDSGQTHIHPIFAFKWRVCFDMVWREDTVVGRLVKARTARCDFFGVL